MTTPDDRPFSCRTAFGPRVAVVGAGIAGLSAARELRRLLPAAELFVLEQQKRVGGLIESEHTPDGFVVDHGPDSLVTAKHESLWAVREAGLEAELVTGGQAPRRAFFVHEGRFLPMPDGLALGVPTAIVPLLRSPLLSVAGKLRLLLEPLWPRVRAECDESVSSFVTRRFGGEVAQSLVEPLVRGIFGTDATQLSAQACIARLVQLERDHGSIALGMYRASRGRRASSGAPQVVALRRGMARLPEGLSAPIADRLWLGVAVSRVSKSPRGYRLETTHGRLDVDALVLSTPAHVTADLVNELDVDLAQLLSEIAHAPVHAVTMAFRREQIPHAMEGTGFLVPATEGRSTTACSFMSHKWPERAPEGQVLVRSLVLGEGMDDAALVAAARADLRELMGVEDAPSHLWLRRRSLALPRYEVGHPERVRKIGERAAQLGAFALAGNALLGVGIPECVRSGRLAAARLEHVLSERRDGAFAASALVSSHA